MLRFAEVPCSINYGASVTPCNSSDARQIAKALIRDRLLAAHWRFHSAIRLGILGQVPCAGKSFLGASRSIMCPTKTSETDLYAPVRDLLEGQGYEVQAEVKDCDIAATKDGELVVVELKLNFSVDLLAQAADRLRITASVYVAIPKTKMNARGRKWRRQRALLRRLEVGLLVVDLDQSKVDIVLHPVAYQRQRVKQRQRAIIQEMDGRSGDYNQGGSTRTKLITAYREDAIFIACALRQLGPRTPAQLREIGSAKRTTSILYANHYGWFDRIDRGVYSLSIVGGEALEEYSAVVKGCLAQLRL